MNLLKKVLSLKNKSILVVGDTMVDRFIWGKVSRISPEAPVPVVEVKSETETLGGAGNVASNITSLGAKAYIITVVGDDLNGLHMKEMLEDKKINTNYIVVDKQRPTTLKTRIIASNQQVVRVDKEIKGAFSGKTEENILKSIDYVMKQIDGVIISDYAKGIVTDKVLKKIITIAKKKRIPVTVDPKVEKPRPAPYAAPSPVSTTNSPSAPGAIWTRCSSPPTSTPACPAWPARSTGRRSSNCRGPASIRASPCSSRPSPYRSSRPPAARITPASCCAWSGTRPRKS